MRLLLSLLSTILFCTLLSCKKEKSDPVISQSSLVGTWQEYETGTAFAGTTHRITFSSDGSFRVLFLYFTDVMVPKDTCASTHYGYAMGTFTIENSLISFKGNYCDQDYQIFTSNCKGQTAYKESYYCTVSNNELIMGVNYPNESAMVKMKRE